MNKITAYVLIGSVVIIASAFLTIKFLLPKPQTQQILDKNALRIGFALGDLREERWQKDRDLFVAAAEKAGAYVQVTSANSDADLQVTQIENLISQGVNVLVILPYDAVKTAPLIDLAHKANIKVLSYDRLITNADVDFYVTFDNAKVGKLEAEGVTAVTSKGNFAYVGGAPTDNNSVLLKQGSMEVLDPLIKNGSIKLVVDKPTPDWKPDEAYKTIKEYLTSGGKLDAVVAANDGTALGSIRALKEFNLDGKIPVSGQDAELSACQRIVQGTQTVTVYKPIQALAEKAAEIAVTMAQGAMPVKNSEVANGKINVPSYFLEPIAVTKENMDATIIKDGYHTKDEVYLSTK
jgi:D-xylose transport system substrate-binding protein